MTISWGIALNSDIEDNNSSLSNSNGPALCSGADLSMDNAPITCSSDSESVLNWLSIGLFVLLVVITENLLIYDLKLYRKHKARS